MKTKTALLAAALVAAFTLPVATAEAGGKDGRWYQNNRKVVVYRDNGYYNTPRTYRYYNNGYSYQRPYYNNRPYYYNQPYYYRSGPGISFGISIGN